MVYDMNKTNNSKLFAEEWNELARDVTNCLLKPYKYLVLQLLETYYALNGVTGKVDVSGPEASPVIQYALSHLTPSRAIKENVILLGEFNVEEELYIYNFTKMILEGSLKWTGYNGEFGSLHPIMLMNQNWLIGVNNDIEVTGGVIDLNSNGESKAMMGIYFKNVTGLKIHNVDLKDSRTLGAYITVKGCISVLMEMITVYGNNKGLGINVWDGSKDVGISNCIFNDLYDSGIDVASTIGGPPCERVTIDSIKAKGYAGSGYSSGVTISGDCRRVTVTNCTLDNFYFDGIALRNAGGYFPTTAIITNNVITGALRNGIAFDIGVNNDSLGTVIANNTVSYSGVTNIWLAGKNASIHDNDVSRYNGFPYARILVYPESSDLDIHHNKGWRTENCGIATLEGTTINIDPELTAIQPQEGMSKIMTVLASLTGNHGNINVTPKDDSTFDVTVEIQGSYTLYWYAAYKPAP